MPNREATRLRTVSDLLLSDTGDNLRSCLCSWDDNVRFMYHWSAPLYFIGTPRQTLHVQLRQFRELQGQGGHQGPMRHRRQQLHLPAPHLRTVVIAVFFRSIQPDGGTYVFLTLHGGRAPATARGVQL